MCVKPRKSNVSGFPSPLRSRFCWANAQTQSGASCLGVVPVRTLPTVPGIPPGSGPLRPGIGTRVHGESPGGIPPPGALRTVRERLRSYGSHHPAVGLRPRSCQCANMLGSRRATPPSQCSARRWCPRSLLNFLLAHQVKVRLRWRKTGCNADL
jgi:hypothetical protein